jgi:hypothetical protein
VAVVFQELGGVPLNDPTGIASDETHPRAVMVARCPSCQGLVIGFYFNDNRFPSLPGVPTMLGTGQLIWPIDVRPDHAPDGLESPAKNTYAEARRILPFSPMGAAVLCRRCLQHVIRTKFGISKKTLHEEIGEAIKRPELSKNTQGTLDHIRTIGNWGAHPSVDQASTIIEVTPEEADYCLDVLELLFEDLYVRPKTTAAMAAKLKAKKWNING